MSDGIGAEGSTTKQSYRNPGLTFTDEDSPGPRRVGPRCTAFSGKRPVLRFPSPPIVPPPKDRWWQRSLGLATPYAIPESSPPRPSPASSCQPLPLRFRPDDDPPNTAPSFRSRLSIRDNRNIPKSICTSRKFPVHHPPAS